MTTVRRLQETDLPVTLTWRNESREWFHHTGVIGWDDHLAWYRGLGSGDWMFIVEDDGPVAQYGLYDMTDTTAQFGRLLVSPRRRGVGYGRFAVEHATTLAKTVGLKSLHLTVKTDNLPAIALYQAAGFTETGGRRGAVHMEKSL